MKPGHDEIIEAMMRGAAENGLPEIKYSDALAMIRAAAERGWVLAKLPRRATADLMTFTPATARAHNACLDAIETIEMEEGDE